MMRKAHEVSISGQYPTQSLASSESIGSRLQFAKRMSKEYPTTRGSNPISSDSSHLVVLVRHAYMRLLAGDPRDARTLLQRVLSDDCPQGSNISDSEYQFSEPSCRSDASPNDIDMKQDYDRLPASPRISIKMLGRFEISIDGTSPVSGRKPPHRLLGILKVVIASGGCAVKSCTLADALWPDLEGDRAHDAMQVALHRLRRLLGDPDALLLNNGRITLNTQRVEVDAFTMDTLCRDPFLLNHREKAHAALELYQGPFLPEESDSDWTWKTRECLRVKFVNIIETAARELEDQGDQSGAAQLYERAMTVDDVENVLRDGLIRTLRRHKSSSPKQVTHA